jgi:hypothetical protein
MNYVLRSTGEIVKTKHITIDNITYPQQAYPDLPELIPLAEKPSYDADTQKIVRVEGYEENGEWVRWSVVNLSAEELLENILVKRSIEYPSIGDQLDALFHAGVFPEDMAAKIQAVKDNNPKP